MTTKTSKVNVESQFAALSQALQTLADADRLILGGRAYEKAELISVFKGCLDTIATSTAARTDWQKTLTIEKATVAAAQPLRSMVKSYLESRFGRTNPELSTFGFKPAKMPQKTVKTKAAAIDKSKATRTARHTLGSKQKKAIKGAPPVATPTPTATATATATPTPTPTATATATPTPTPTATATATPTPTL